MPNPAQDTEQTLQPPTDNVEFRSDTQPPNRDLTLQPSNDGNSATQPPEEDLTLQPESNRNRAGNSDLGPQADNEGLDLQPPTGTAGNNSTATSGDKDTGLTLQPDDQGAAGKQNTDMGTSTANRWKQQQQQYGEHFQYL